MWYRRYFVLKLILLFIPALFVSGISLFTLLPKEMENVNLPANVELIEQTSTAVDNSAPLLLAKPTARFAMDMTRETAVSSNTPIEVGSNVKATDVLSGAVGKREANSG